LLLLLVLLVLLLLLAGLLRSRVIRLTFVAVSVGS
jgi:hypothetical protein